MKRTKKILALFLAAMMTTLSFSGCASEPSSSSSASQENTVKEVTFCESWDFEGGLS